MSNETLAFIYALSLALLVVTIGGSVFGGFWITKLLRDLDEARDRHFGGV